MKFINFSFGLLFFHYFFTLCHRCYDVRCYGEGGVSDVTTNGRRVVWLSIWITCTIPFGLRGLVRGGGGLVRCGLVIWSCILS